MVLQAVALAQPLRRLTKQVCAPHCLWPESLSLCHGDMYSSGRQCLFRVILEFDYFGAQPGTNPCFEQKGEAVLVDCMSSE